MTLTDADQSHEQDLGRVGTYTVADAAHYLSLPDSTVRGWAFGHSYATKAGRVDADPIIEAANPGEKLLSFENLVELHVLSALRRAHRVTLQKIREAVSYLEADLDTPHPLAQAEMMTDGSTILIEHLGSLVDASERGQVVIAEILQGYLTRIERNAWGSPQRLFPVTRPDVRNAPRSVAIDPRYQFGRPFLTDSGVRTDAIADRYRAGESTASLAEDYGQTASAIEEAIRYELLRAA